MNNNINTSSINFLTQLIKIKNRAVNDTPQTVHHCDNSYGRIEQYVQILLLGIHINNNPIFIRYIIGNINLVIYLL